VILYDHPASANCLKVRILLAQLGVSYERVTVDLFAGETRRPEHLARNPDGRVPVLELDSGELLPESAAIMLYLAEGTPYLPEDRLARVRKAGVEKIGFAWAGETERGNSCAIDLRVVADHIKRGDGI